MRSILFVLVFLVNNLQSKCQNRYVNWFFAYGSGMNFTSSGPSIINGGKTASEEGVASISDPCGNLLFYSDGTAIWNKKHSVMVNGNSLKGNTQSAEAVLIVPMPLSDSLYYVFTTDAYGGNNGLQYSIVDMSKQGGDGEVINKNVQLFGKSSEKVTAVLHSNKKDYWIITHDWINGEYKIYLLTDIGLNTTPNIYKIGPVTNTSVENAIGHLRPSPDGTKIASTFWYKGMLEIYNFNNSNGNFSLFETLTNFDHTRPFSIEFSPNNKILYVGEAATGGNNDIYQFDMTAANIGSSRFKVATATNYRIGNFCLGADSKFYVARFDQTSLGVISNPDKMGSGVSYNENGFSLGSQKCKLGLPNQIFPIEIQNPEYALSAVAGCKLSDPVKLELLSNFCYDSLVWDLADYSSLDNFSRKRKLSHVYPYKGNYDITLKVYLNGKNYTYNKNVKVPASPIVNLGKDTFLCGNFSYFLDAGNPGATYLWHDNYMGKVRNATIPGKYFVTATLGACKGSDTLIIKNASGLNLGRDTTLCFDNTYNFTLNSADSVIWQDGFNGKNRNLVSPGGAYRANVYKNKCITKDTILILLPGLYPDPLPKDTVICQGESVQINLPNTSINYLWNDGSANGSKTITNKGSHKLVQTKGNCIVTDSFILTVISRVKLPETNDTSICIGDDIYINTNLNDAILKINGLISTGNTHRFFQKGFYLITAENTCFNDTVAFNLELDSCKVFEVIVPDIFSPNGDLLNENFMPVILGNPAKIKNFNFGIYNRWGENIFETVNYRKGWDGKYSSNPCPAGYYIWICNLKYLEHNETKLLQMHGLVFLLR